VAHAIQRLKEAEKLGFGQAALPSGTEELSSGIGANAFQPATLTDLVIRIAGSRRGQAED
jgi:DNA repair protein RadA/Sms